MNTSIRIVTLARATAIFSAVRAVGHMLDMARKAVTKTRDLSREGYDADESLRLALIHLSHADS